MKKIRVAIITIAHGSNYGNKLQNYALASILGRYGSVVETFRQRVSIFTVAHDLVKRLRHPLRSLAALPTERHRERTFADFNSRYLKFSKHVIGRKTNLKKFAKDYDYFVLGSDQIWNPYFRMYNRAAMFGYGLREGQAVPYAPSFGVSAIPEDKKAEISKYLNALSYISVREQKGVELVKELTGRNDAVHVLDPTMLLDAKDYRLVAKKPDLFTDDRNYILTYFLGDNANALQSEIEQYAKRNNLKIINLNDAADEVTYAYGPSEFLYLFDHAELILTDSFHATVFSITFRRPFVVYGRERKNEASMNSRIESLLSIVGMQDRYNIVLGSSSLFKVDYSKVGRRIANERKTSLAYLEKALGLR